MIDRMSETVAPRSIRPVLYFSMLCSLFVLFIVPGCGGRSAEEERQEQVFLETYVELLIIREQFPDTADANPRVRALMRQQGYSEASFQKHFAALARDADHFRETIDSARSLARLIQRGQDSQPDTSETGGN